jgi:hypothetical protein
MRHRFTTHSLRGLAEAIGTVFEANGRRDSRYIQSF